MSKDSGMRIRIERGLRDRFIEICRKQDRPAAQVIREFMREYVATHGTKDVANESGTSPIERRLSLMAQGSKRP